MGMGSLGVALSSLPLSLSVCSSLSAPLCPSVPLLLSLSLSLSLPLSACPSLSLCPSSELTLVARGLGDADAVLVGDVGVLGVRELEARDPPVAGDVVDLLGDLAVGQGGQEGEGLEELV